MHKKVITIFNSEYLTLKLFAHVLETHKQGPSDKICVNIPFSRFSTYALKTSYYDRISGID